jgi:hypothetical protein
MLFVVIIFSSSPVSCHIWNMDLVLNQSRNSRYTIFLIIFGAHMTNLFHCQSEYYFYNHTIILVPLLMCSPISLKHLSLLVYVFRSTRKPHHSNIDVRSSKMSNWIRHTYLISYEMKQHKLTFESSSGQNACGTLKYIKIVTKRLPPQSKSTTESARQKVNMNLEVTSNRPTLHYEIGNGTHL